jgi:hypothetical protein
MTVSTSIQILTADDVRARRLGRNHRAHARPMLMAIGIVALTAVIGAAQYGHPLKGQWSGDWGPNKTTRHRLLLDLNWDGKAITGTINPGPNAVPLQKASVDPSTWNVRFEAEGKGPAGAIVRYLVEGKLENLGSYRRVLVGTWTQGAERGDFRLTRN